MRKVAHLRAAVAVVATACQATAEDPPETTSAPPTTTTTSTVPSTTAPTTTTTTPPARSIDAAVEVDGNTVTVTVEASGFDVEFVRGDTIGQTGHLHLYVDRDPPAAGDVVPLGQPDVVHSLGKTLTVTLEAGAHILWLVAADGSDRALIPPAPIRIDVTIEG